MFFNKGKGFTLVELLVVISIIALLLAIVVPLLQRVKEKARSVYCLSNLRQMSIAASTYVCASDDFFPIAQWCDDNKSYCWDFIVYTQNDVEIVEPGLLWIGDTIEKVHQCPSYKGSSNWGLVETFTGYNYNTSYIGHGQGESVSSKYAGKIIPHPVWPQLYEIVMPAKSQSLKRPGECALFGDGHYSGGANKFMRCPEVWYGDRFASIKSAGTQGYRHLGKTNVAFCDGHSESRKERFTNTNAIAKRNIDKYNEISGLKTGFLSEDNSMYDMD